ncbi:MAG: hypothetical protein WBI82_09715 [Sphaerochaeta sp.]
MGEKADGRNNPLHASLMRYWSGAQAEQAVEMVVRMGTGGAYCIRASSTYPLRLFISSPSTSIVLPSIAIIL